MITINTAAITNVKAFESNRRYFNTKEIEKVKITVLPSHHYYKTFKSIDLIFLHNKFSRFT